MPRIRSKSRGGILRLLEIGAVGLRYVLPGVVSGLRAHSARPAAAAVRRACERLGPAFIKLGQFLSVRPDLLSAEALAELELLQDAAPPVGSASIRLAVEGELGASVEELFREFDWAPVASASVSQVHRAVLPSGDRVAVKVQRLGVAQSILRDVRLAGRVLETVLRWTPLGRRVDCAALEREVLAACEAELDFRCEAEAAEILARHLRHAEGVRIPKVHWAFTTRRVLTTEFIEGIKISDARAVGRADYAELALRGARAFLCQILEGGLFHADLHPANILITPKGEIAYLDFGIVGRLSPEERESILGAIVGLIARDAVIALRHLARMGVQVPADRVEGFTRDIGRVIDAAAGLRLADVSVARIGRGVLSAVHRHGVVFPRKYALLVKALLTIEGTARALHPGFSFEEVAAEYLREAARRTLRAGQLGEALWRGAALLGLGALAAAEE